MALVTRLVLREAERNIQAKLDEKELLRFYSLMAELDPRVMPQPSEEEIETAASVVGAKSRRLADGRAQIKPSARITVLMLCFHPGIFRQPGFRSKL